MDQNLAETRRAVRERGPSSLIIDDLQIDDLPDIAWSGTEVHLRSVAGYLARTEEGQVEYLVAACRQGWFEAHRT